MTPSRVMVFQTYDVYEDFMVLLYRQPTTFPLMNAAIAALEPFNPGKISIRYHDDLLFRLFLAVEIEVLNETLHLDFSKVMNESEDEIALYLADQLYRKLRAIPRIEVDETMIILGDN